MSILTWSMTELELNLTSSENKGRVKTWCKAETIINVPNDILTGAYSPEPKVVYKEPGVYLSMQNYYKTIIKWVYI